MNDIPQFLLKRILSSLPFLDAVLLRRVCSTFEHLLRSRFIAVTLDLAELDLWFRARAIPFPGWEAVIRGVLDGCGHLTKTLKIKFFRAADADVFEKSCCDWLVRVCPNLVELELRVGLDKFGEAGYCRFPAKLLPQFANLQSLKCCLGAFDDLNPCDVNGILQKIEAMSEIAILQVSPVFSAPNGIDRCLGAIKGVLFSKRRGTNVGLDFSRFPNLEAVIFQKYSYFSSMIKSLAEQNLRKLDLGMLHVSESARFTIVDHRFLLKFKNLTHFSVDCLHLRNNNNIHHERLGYFRASISLQDACIWKAWWEIITIEDPVNLIGAIVPFKSVSINCPLTLKITSELLKRLKSTSIKIEHLQLQGSSEDDVLDFDIDEFCDLIGGFAASLRSLLLWELPVPNKTFFDSITDQLSTNLEHLEFEDLDERAAPDGVLGFLGRRKSLVAEAKIGGERLPTLLKLKLHERLRKRIEEDSQIVSDAFVCLC